MLRGLRDCLGEPDAKTLQSPFIVPPLSLNPATAASSAAAHSTDDRVMRAGPQRLITRIGVAAGLASDGGVIEIDPGEYVADAAVWTGRNGIGGKPAG